ncbi:phosphate regulon sensor histidine kinase PhoR [Roseateles sp. DB2]|uniref:phosphate regulon sensor histidine kinase PhoR n=1 Tax=Roseateles sp. DB2 TaxID=3453717 RepID=UPI003EED2DB6
MTWMLPRVVLAALAVLLGAGLAWLLGRWWPELPWLPPLTGALIGVAALFTVDSLRAHRLMQWLRGAQAGAAPRDRGLWGELAYRMERAVRDRDRAIERERQELLQFLSAIEASPNGVLMLDAEDHIRWCNRVAADHFSLDPQRDRDQRVTNLVRFPAFVALLQSGDYSQPLVLSHVRGRLTLAVVVRAYGDGMRLVLTQDITERERAEAMRRDFVANVSHEIRTPLTVLAGFIETMASLPLTEPERRRVLSLMNQQTQRMQSLVSDLLTLAQLEGSPRPDADRWVGAQALLQRVLSDASALSHGRHELVLDSGPSAELAGVEAELLSAVANLANNAVRYTPDGGRIELSFGLLADGSCEISVSDSGPGIAREHVPRLTERFYRVDGSRSRDTGGTGLGLSIVKHVAQRHGGELKIDSELGKGSRFRVALPAARVRSVEALGVEAARVPEGSL